jgi:hypothetical protein
MAEARARALAYPVSEPGVDAAQRGWLAAMGLTFDNRCSRLLPHLRRWIAR